MARARRRLKKRSRRSASTATSCGAEMKFDAGSEQAEVRLTAARRATSPPATGTVVEHDLFQGFAQRAARASAPAAARARRSCQECGANVVVPRRRDRDQVHLLRLVEGARAGGERERASAPSRCCRSPSTRSARTRRSATGSASCGSARSDLKQHGQGAGGRRRLRALLDLRRARRLVVDRRGRLLLLRDEEYTTQENGQTVTEDAPGAAHPLGARLGPPRRRLRRRAGVRVEGPAARARRRVRRPSTPSSSCPTRPASSPAGAPRSTRSICKTASASRSGKMETRAGAALRRATCRATRTATSRVDNTFSRAHLQARALAGLDRGLSLQQQGLPLPGQRADRRGGRQGAVELDQDRAVHR